MSETRALRWALTRRRAMALGSSLAFWSLWPRAAFGGSRHDTRFLLVVLRGGVDGLALAPPIGDPDYLALRSSLVPEEASGAPLDGFFALHPSLPTLRALYERREAIIFHAVSTRYRERSHFEGQRVLETGVDSGDPRAGGWLNRALTMLPAGEGPRALSLDAVTPLVMRGEAKVQAWSPLLYPHLDLNESIIARLLALYDDVDPALGAALADGVALEERYGGQPGEARGPHASLASLASFAGRALADPQGFRIGALSYEGWDTHFNAGVVAGHFARQLEGLDIAIRALRDSLGGAWARTAILFVTEFGRTVRPNGSGGTDHGTGTTALLIGGAVNGGRVISNWPGLKPGQMQDGRDLAATIDLEAVQKGVLIDYLGFSRRALESTVFPDSVGVAPVTQLFA